MEGVLHETILGASGSLLPVLKQRSIFPIHRIAIGQRDLLDILVRMRSFAFLAVTHVEVDIRRISTDHGEVAAGAQSIVADAGGDQHHIARFDFEIDARFAAEPDRGGPMRHAKHFVSVAVIMMEWIDAVAPEAGPAIGARHRLNRVLRILRRQAKRPGIDQQRTLGIVRNRSRVLQVADDWYARLHNAVAILHEENVAAGSTTARIFSGTAIYAWATSFRRNNIIEPGRREWAWFRPPHPP